MSNKNDIVNPLEHLPKLNCFKVPQGYFERLQHTIELRVALDAMPFESQLSAIKNRTAFSLPNNYFDSLAARIAAQTTDSKPLLETLPQNEGFIVPQGYFNTLYLRIADRVNAGAAAASRPWWQPAPALRPILAFAGIGLVIGAAVFFTNIGVTNTQNGMAALKTKAIAPKTTITAPAIDNNTLVADIAVTKHHPTKKNHADTHPANTTNEADLLSLTGAYSDVDDIMLSEIPTTAQIKSNTDGLVEILAEEDIDLEEVINVGM